VLGLTDVLRHDLTGSGVQAAVLCPGLVATKIFDARRNRPEAFGGAVRVAAEHLEGARAMMAKGQAPDLTAELCFEGLDRGDFIIITDPNVRQFVESRLSEVAKAVDRVEQRLP
jgi:short-subunit dehydrogenase